MAPIARRYSPNVVTCESPAFVFGDPDPDHINTCTSSART